jgi:hypothetical protein
MWHATSAPIINRVERRAWGWVAPSRASSRPTTRDRCAPARRTHRHNIHLHHARLRRASWSRSSSPRRRGTCRRARRHRALWCPSSSPNRRGTRRHAHLRVRRRRMPRRPASFPNRRGTRHHVAGFPSSASSGIVARHRGAAWASAR